MSDWLDETSPLFASLRRAIAVGFAARARAVLEDACKQKGLSKKTKSRDWLKLYESILPESERKERVKID
jgi:hypothetical protein